MRMLVAVVLLVALAGCGPAGGERTVDVRGSIRAVAASGGSDSWVLRADGDVLLPLLIEGEPLLGAHCVTVRVPEDFESGEEHSSIVAALQELVERTEESLEVVGWCE